MGFPVVRGVNRIEKVGFRDPNSGQKRRNLKVSGSVDLPEDALEGKTVEVSLAGGLGKSPKRILKIHRVCYDGFPGARYSGKTTINHIPTTSPRHAVQHKIASNTATRAAPKNIPTSNPSR